jgi:RNA polymerase sigma-54 factor
MRMNPRLYQAMDLLYMPLLDLQQHLKTELLENPFLEMAEAEEDTDAPTEKNTEDQERERAEQEKQDEIDWEEIVLDGFDVGRSRGEYEVSEAYEPVQAATRNLTDHLRDQITLLKLTLRQQLLADEFLGSIGDDGYLQISVEEVVEGANHLLDMLREAEPVATEPAPAPIPEGHPLASQTLDAEPSTSAIGPPPAAPEESDEPYTMEEGEELLRVLQQLDPPGVAARDLRECLLLQLGNNGDQDTLTYRLVQEAYEDLISHRWSDLAKRFGLEPKAVQDAADLLAKLDPKPGLQYSAGDNVYVTPDLVVEKVDGEYRVFLNDGGVPRLRISKMYRELAGDKKKFVGESKEFVTNKLNSATWLIQAIEQRRQTMLKVMNFIVDRQREYFEKATHAAGGRRRHQHARIHGEPRDEPEVRADTPRGVAPQVLLLE